jgi:hypothetical protein
VALPALVVLGLVAVVAIASTGSTPSGSAATRPPSETLFDTLYSVGLVALAIGAILLVYGFAQRKAIAQEVASGRYQRTSLLTYLVFVGVFTGFTAWRMGEWEFTPAAPEEGDLVFTGTEVVPAIPEQTEASYEPGISWIPLALVVGLVLSAVVAYFVSEQRARRGRHARVLLVEQLAAALDESLDDLRAEPDPRRAVIAAYARLERVLAANGVPRRPAETSDEYLARVLHDLELDPGAVGRLTALFTRAKFSAHAVDVGMKDEAIRALEQTRDELRAIAGAEATVDAAPAPLEARV